MTDQTFRLNTDDVVYFYWTQFKYSLVFCPCVWPVTCPIAPCTKQNITDFAHAVDVKITKTSLVHTTQRIKTCWRCTVCDQGRITKEIPFEKITDVVVTEPAGGCCPPNILYTVAIQTAGRSGVDGPELTITGLSKDDVYKVRSLIQQRRRGQRMSRV